MKKNFKLNIMTYNKNSKKYKQKKMITKKKLTLLSYNNKPPFKNIYNNAIIIFVNL